jgi:DHA2 family multidrug resistance protein-like MFS transporter
MEMTTSGSPGAQAGRREWLGLAVLAVPTLLLSLDISVLYLALPHLSASLKASSTQQLWVVDIYSFMTSAFLVTMGTLGDRIGRRKLLLIGAAVFACGSAMAAYSVNTAMLITARALLGVAAATLLPSALALIRNMFHNPQQMAKAMGIWFSCFMGGMALGPIVGGVLLDNFWWGSAFLIAIPVMVAVLIAGPILLPEYRNPENARLDIISVAMSMAAILPVIYGLKELAENGLHVVPIVTIVVGVVFGVLFARRQRRLPNPLFDLRLFSNRTFSASLSTMLIAGVVMAGTSLLAALYLQSVKGLSPLTAGLALLPQNFAMVFGSMLAPALIKKFRPAYVMVAGLATSLAGLLVLTQVSSTSGTWLLIIGLVFTTGGLALPMVLTSSLMVGAAPPEKAGAAAGMMETSGEFGVAIGIAAMGSLGAFIYRSQLPVSLAHVPAHSTQAARGSLAVALTTAAKLPGAVSGELVNAARIAFTDGLNIVAATGAGIFLVLAVAVAVALRHVDPPAAPQAPFTPGDQEVAGAEADQQAPVTAGSESH